MERLWTPWRRAYVGGERATGDDTFQRLAAESQANDAANLILLRGDWCFVIMNLFPYTTGHLMIVPYRKVAEPAEMTVNEWRELTELISRLTGVLRHVLRPDGFNIGMNVGTAAGAGIPDHLHLHIVPRWVGDTNFMPVLGTTKVLPELLPDTYARLRRALDQIASEPVPSESIARAATEAGDRADHDRTPPVVGDAPSELAPRPADDPPATRPNDVLTMQPAPVDGSASRDGDDSAVVDAIIVEVPAAAAMAAVVEVPAVEVADAIPVEALPAVAQAGAVVLLRDKVVLRLARDGSWVLPKGHLEPGETPEAAAIREVAEEMALSGRLGPHLGELRFPYRGRERRVQYYLFQADRRLTAWNDHLDRDTFLFTPRDALSRLTHPEARAILAQALEIARTK